MADTPPKKHNVTGLLLRLQASHGDDARIRDDLFAAVYDELRRMASLLMRGERAGHTLQPTALVHEIFLRLVRQDDLEWRDRAHFLGIAARAMRQVLIDHARRRQSVKRGGGWERVTLTEFPGDRDPALEVIELDEILKRLSGLSQRMARVVEMRVFGGMTHQEVAEVLSVSERTAADDWSVARRWLARELGGASP